MEKLTKQQYSFGVKKEVVQRHLAGETRMDLAREFGLSSDQLIKDWARKWREGGDGALKLKPKGKTQRLCCTEAAYRRRETAPLDRASGVGAWSAGGVSAYHALGVDEAALDAGGWLPFFDGVVGSLSAVDDGDGWWVDAFEEALVVEGGFVCAPVPGDDVVDGGGDDQAAGGG